MSGWVDGISAWAKILGWEKDTTEEPGIQDYRPETLECVRLPQAGDGLDRKTFQTSSPSSVPREQARADKGLGHGGTKNRFHAVESGAQDVKK